MNKRERIEAALAGRPVDRVPGFLWRRFPIADQAPASLAEAVVAFARAYDFDAVVIAPSVTDVAEGWGASSTYLGSPDGARYIAAPAIGDWSRWLQIEPLAPGSGRLAGQLDAVRRVRAALGPDVPLFLWVPSPLTVARQLRGEAAARDGVEHPIELREGLRAITETLASLASGALDAGASGIYLAATCASADVMPAASYAVHGQGYDLMVLDAVRERGRLTIVGAPEGNPHFDVLATYPVGGLNWSDRASGPSLSEGAARFPGAVIGGMDERAELFKGPPRAIGDRAREAMRSVGPRRLILGAGGPIAVDTPDLPIRAFRLALG